MTVMLVREALTAQISFDFIPNYFESSTRLCSSALFSCGQFVYGYFIPNYFESSTRLLQVLRFSFLFAGSHRKSEEAAMATKSLALKLENSATKREVNLEQVFLIKNTSFVLLIRYTVPLAMNWFAVSVKNSSFVIGNIFEEDNSDSKESSHDEPAKLQAVKKVRVGPCEDMDSCISTLFDDVVEEKFGSATIYSVTILLDILHSKAKGTACLNIAISSIEDQLGAPVSEIFADINLEPIVAAILGQVF
ncbi:hypothetical protein SSX86_032654 [Deinandra increscens subsp. villosa]|uniref:Uncharacterized protein n=1 Tax=Deinandra increscens subsp. villosa TaxID=3103831 RepID=A0AAP0C7P4_9ASTR